MNSLNPSILKKLKFVVGEKGWLDDSNDMAPYLSDERNLFHGKTNIILKPQNSAEVAKIVKICAQEKIGIVPQGGNTGYCGGSIPNPNGLEVVISLARLNRIREINTINNTMTVEAGCILSDIQTKAKESNKLFPLSLGAEGSCQIGGNLATNAGGTQVLHYGNARDLVLGLEVILPDGQLLNMLRALRKNNTGYDLKHLFLGSEGTLGIITAAVIKLFPLPKQVITSIVALPNSSAAVSLLTNLQSKIVGSITSFEFFNRSSLELVIEHISNARDPFVKPYDTYVLLEISSSQSKQNIKGSLENQLSEKLDEGCVLDAVIADSGEQCKKLWKLRESIPEAQKCAGGCIKHDVSVPISRIAEFISLSSKLAKKEIKGVRVIAFGHIGDGNIHFNLTQPLNIKNDDFLSHTLPLSTKIHEIAMKLGGSFSAEHGIGILKKHELKRFKSLVEQDLMELVKDAIDPENIMNPDKVVTVKPKPHLLD